MFFNRLILYQFWGRAVLGPGSFGVRQYWGQAAVGRAKGPGRET